LEDYVVHYGKAIVCRLEQELSNGVRREFQMNEFLVRMDLGGPGPTIAIKDTIDIDGYPTEAGSFSLLGTPKATRHAVVVERLLASGWRIVGKTNMHELAFGLTGINDFEGTPINPQDPLLIPGGSSSGSAVAVGNYSADAALGSDTGGSIRVPAACCGVYGFKPTFDRVSREGVVPEHTTMDCVGPFARNMKTLISVMRAIEPAFGAEYEVARTAVSAGWAVGVVKTDADPRILEALDEMLHVSGWKHFPRLLPGLMQAFTAGLQVMNHEVWESFGDLLIWGKLGPDVEKRLRLAADITAEQVQTGEAVRRSFTEEVDAALQSVDALLLPTMPVFPLTLEAARTGASPLVLSTYVRPFNLSGHPAIAIPVPSVTGIKTSVQLVGRRGSDAALCSMASDLERALHTNCQKENYYDGA
jgi:amidase